MLADKSSKDPRRSGQGESLAIASEEGTVRINDAALLRPDSVYKIMISQPNSNELILLSPAHRLRPSLLMLILERWIWMGLR